MVRVGLRKGGLAVAATLSRRVDLRPALRPHRSTHGGTWQDLSVLILLSPAKSLDYHSRVPTRKHTEPRMLDESAALVDVMRTKSVPEVADMMSISLELADLNVRRFVDFSLPFTMRNARQAV